MTVIPELEKLRGTFKAPSNAIWSKEDDDTVLRYFRRVATREIRKHIAPEHQGKDVKAGCDAIRKRYCQLLKHGKKPIEPADGKPTDGLSAGKGDEKPPEKAASPKAKLEKLKDGKKPDARRLACGWHRHSKWQLPMKHGEPGYEKARKLCVKFGKPYPEALKMQEAEDAQKAGTEKPPATEDTPDKTQPDGESDGDKITMDKAPATMMVTGMKVQQIRPDNGRQFYGTGTIVARERNGQILHVRNGGGKIYKIDAKCLQLAKAGDAIKQGAELARS